ncbi:MAG TPA: hypothetical protein VJK54_03680, partial [Chthoniobacterales bacterium]|nr:hypothetical protein [Chthoniobacterales bacterium]
QYRAPIAAKQLRLTNQSSYRQVSFLCFFVAIPSAFYSDISIKILQFSLSSRNFNLQELSITVFNL